MVAGSTGFLQQSCSAEMKQARRGQDYSVSVSSQVCTNHKVSAPTQCAQVLFDIQTFWAEGQNQNIS